MKLTAKQRFQSVLLGALTSPFDAKYGTACFTASVTGNSGQWDGWQQNRMRNRPGVRLAGDDVDRNYGIREALLSEARSLAQTDDLINSITEKYSEYCVGKCICRWDTLPDAINKQYRSAWRAWSNICDFRGVHTFPKLMQLSVAGGVRDGDMFCQLVDSSGYGQLNFIESDRVSSSGIFNADTEDMVGGVGLDENRRRKFIRVWKRTFTGQFKDPVEIPKQNYLQFFLPSRVDAVRGVTRYATILNAARDRLEIAAASLAKTKRSSKIDLIVKTITGGALVSPFNPVPPAGGATKNRVEQWSPDGETRFMFSSEDMKLLEQTTPGTPWQEHMTFVIRCIATGARLPFGVVWSMAGLNKPAVLFELQQAARVIVKVQEELETRFIRPICGWWLSKEITAGRLPFHPLWYQFSISRPPYISIDAGRDSQAAQNESKLAMRSMKSWFLETEEDWQEEFDQCVTERSYLEIACKKLGIDPNTVRMLQQTGASAPPDEKEPTGNQVAGSA